MAERPDFLDLHTKPLDPSTKLAIPSPRILYNDGEIPPALSPLDAFAAQSRMLAKQLDIKKAGERRMSRLPPAMVTKSLSEHRADRPTMFRSLSEESGRSRFKDEDVSGSSPTIANPQDRPLSQHPRISEVPTPATNSEEAEGLITPIYQSSTSQSSYQPPTPTDYFGLPRTASPAPTSVVGDHRVALDQSKAETTSSLPGVALKQQVRTRTDSSYSQSESAFPPFPSVRSVPHHESSDDDYSSSIAGSSFSNSRKLSSSSGVSAPYSPLSPFVPGRIPRSPSINSEASINGFSAPRPAWNFSRPRSSASLSILSRKNSATAQQGVDSKIPQSSTSAQRILQAHPQIGDPDSEDNNEYLSGGGPSYTYVKFSLPRGRMVSRDSTIFQGLSTPHFEWKEPLFQDTPVSSAPSNAHLASSVSPPKPSLDPYQDPSNKDGPTFQFGFTPARPSTPEQHDQPKQSTSPAHSFKSHRSTKSLTSLPGRTSAETGGLGSSRAGGALKSDAEDTKSVSSRSNSTLRANSTKTGATNTAGYRHMSPEDHVTKAIECHENGSLQESTYHLRVAAMQNHPTAMLLYALACRHGWGMRPNPREGVQWLRKALDCAMLEVAEDEDPTSETGVRDFHNKAARRAQFALSIYELGVSHLKGWGIEQDKALALRCFEVAGHWGDVDALTEAGFCYAEGIGCKKDLKKAARFYRMAEQRGVSMVGNSWIYKDKYNDPEEASRSRTLGRSADASQKKPRDKSRTRSIFTRKKSFQ